MHKLTVSLVALVGCVTQLNGNAAFIKDSDGTGLAGCEFLGEHSASSMFHGGRGDDGVEDCKNKIRNKVADLGATHINWSNASQSDGGTTVIGRVYRCPKK